MVRIKSIGKSLPIIAAAAIVLYALSRRIQGEADVHTPAINQGNIPEATPLIGSVVSPAEIEAITTGALAAGLLPRAISVTGVPLFEAPTLESILVQPVAGGGMFGYDPTGGTGPVPVYQQPTGMIFTGAAAIDYAQADWYAATHPSKPGCGWTRNSVGQFVQVNIQSGALC